MYKSSAEQCVGGAERPLNYARAGTIHVERFLSRCRTPVAAEAVDNLMRLFVCSFICFIAPTMLSLSLTAEAGNYNSNAFSQV